MIAMLLFLACALPAASVSVPGAPAAIELRDGGGRLEGTIAREDASGITVAGAGGERFLRWDQVRSVSDAGGDTEIRRRRLDSGELLWRGRIRFARGDMPGARTMFLKAAEAMDPGASVPAMLAAEGLARSGAALANAAPETLEAALRAAAYRAALARPESWLPGADPVDPESGLMLSVPPSWPDEAAARGARGRLKAAADAAAKRGESQLEALFRTAARIAAAEAGEPEAPSPLVANAASRGLPKTPLAFGIRVLSAWADAVSSDAQGRRRGRDALRACVRSGPDALRGWGAYAEGRSLCLENDPDEVRLGAARLLRVPALHASACPVLAAAAFARSAAALERAGDRETAAKVREVAKSFDGRREGPPGGTTP